MTMIVGIGTDIVSLSRIQALLTRTAPGRFAARILSPCELADFRGRFSGVADLDLDRPLPVTQLGTGVNADLVGEPVGARRVVQFLGGRFAAKEAAFKAMQPHFHLGWSQVSVLSSASGKPTLVLEREVLASQRIGAAHVSISHDGDYAIAHVVLEGEAASREAMGVPAGNGDTGSYKLS
ncbi:4'-phosphopantetheinyl transferase superfamily [Zopfochytrium polystomum]|nr:4'-phosphopantetheinyl transferase superfamily [Zopfochytrium polystomum]